MALVLRGKVYHAAVYINGKTRWKSTKTRDKELAKKKEAEFLLTYSPTTGIDKRPWNGFKEAYLKEKGSSRNRLLTIRTFEDVMLGAGKPIKTLSDLNQDNVEQFRKIRRTMFIRRWNGWDAFIEGTVKVKEATINKEIQILKAMSKWAEECNPPWVDVDPLRRVKQSPLPKRVPKPYSKEEIERLRECCLDTFDRVMIDLAYYTGRRRSEVYRMRWDQIDFNRKIVNPSGESNKIKDEGIVPLHPKLEVTLLEWRKECPDGVYILEMHGRQLWGPGYITNNMKNISKRADIKGSYHRFRHTLISRLADKNINSLRIRDMVGHKDVSTTQGYTQTEVESVRQEFNNAL